MPKQKGNLDLLFGQVDSWFQDLTLKTPIKQFCLDDGDRARLATISRTTANWFKSLTNPRITNLEDDFSEVETEDSHLDNLARNLELLLEQDPSNERYYSYKFYDNDELALLDENIGNCFTLECVSPNETILDRTMVSAATVASTGIRGRQQRLCSRQTTSPTISDSHGDKKRVRMKPPLDHDYLPHPEVKPPKWWPKQIVRRLRLLDRNRMTLY